MTAMTLFDAPGPRARRRIRVYVTVATVILLAFVAAAVQRYWQAGQFSMQKWGPIIDPHDPNFALLWTNLWDGLQKTLIASVLAITASFVLGVVLAAVRVGLNRWTTIPLVGFMELIRGVPLVVIIYFVARVLPDYGVTLDFLPGGPFLWYLVIGLCIYNTVVIAEILRGGINALPKGQTEAGLAIGLTHNQTIRHIVLPQAIRIALPAILSQLVVVVKDTSLAAVVLGQFPEFLRTTNLIIVELHNPLQLYTVVAIVYIALNAALSALAGWLARRNRATRASKPGAADPAAGVAPALTVPQNPLL